MNIEPYKTPNHLECIRCGKCKTACKAKAIYTGFKVKK
jgi:ferredoxin